MSKSNPDTIIEALASQAQPVRPLASPVQRALVWFWLPLISLALGSLVYDVSPLFFFETPQHWPWMLGQLLVSYALFLFALVRLCQSVVPAQPLLPLLWAVILLMVWTGLTLAGFTQDPDKYITKPVWQEFLECCVVMILAAAVPFVTALRLAKGGAVLSPATVAQQAAWVVVAISLFCISFLEMQLGIGPIAFVTHGMSAAAVTLAAYALARLWLRRHAV